MVSEVSTRGYLALLFGAYGEAEHHGRRHLPHGRQHKERGRGQALNIPFKKGTPTTGHLLEVPPPRRATTGWGASLQYRGLGGQSRPTLLKMVKNTSCPDDCFHRILSF